VKVVKEEKMELVTFNPDDGLPDDRAND
jgi:hypothetical protein